MHVAIDAENLKITHVHPDREIRDSLLYLEGTKIKHAITYSTDHPSFLRKFSPVELAMLYRNTTGQQIPPQLFSFDQRVAAMREIIEGMIPRDAVLDELVAQIEIAQEYLEQNVSESLQFRYVKGSKKPSMAEQGLFPITHAPLTPEQVAKAAIAAPQAALEEPPATAPAKPQRERSVNGSGLRVRQSNTRPTIWAVADQLWEAAGKPTDKTAVLKLRKEMMDELEKRSIKRTTSSNELGNWQKARLA